MLVPPGQEVLGSTSLGGSTIHSPESRARILHPPTHRVPFLKLGPDHITPPAHHPCLPNRYPLCHHFQPSCCPRHNVLSFLSFCPWSRFPSPTPALFFLMNSYSSSKTQFPRYKGSSPTASLVSSCRGPTAEFNWIRVSLL